MGRQSAAALDDRAAAHDRLQAMRLRSDRTGWVPEPVAAPATSIEPDSAGADDDDRRQPLPSLGELARAWAADRLPPWVDDVFDRLHLGSLLIGVAVVFVVVLVAVMALHHHQPTGYSSSYDASATGQSFSSDPAVSAAPSAAADGSSIVVDVGGRVRKPGLVTLPQGARVADAIAAAGGPLHHREIAMLDLAARVSDGQLLLIGVKSAPTSSGAASDGTSADGSAAPVSLSTATIDGLETLPGVGPVTAQKIIDWRTAHNGFTTVEQLQQVSGIGPARYAELSPLVTP
jgi:competence protein ComEA